MSVTLQHSMRYKVSLDQQHSVSNSGVSDSAAFHEVYGCQ